MLLEAENLACRRGMRVVFRDVGFALAPGDALLVRGPNGSGKSSLLRVLAGLLPAMHGNLRRDGDAVNWDDHRARLHYIGHQDAVKPELTVREMVDYWRVLQGGMKQETPSPAKTKDLPRGKSKFSLPLPQGERNISFVSFGLDNLEDRKVRTLSAGQKRRLALARLAMREAPLWLLDEPATSLDNTGQELLAHMLGEHRARGGAVIIAAHHEIDLPDAKHLSLGEKHMSGFRLLRHDLRLQMRRSGEWVALLLFFVIVILLLPFALGPEPDLLRRLAPGLIWLAALLMSLLALESLFVEDARDGTLDLMLLSPVPLPLIVFIRVAAQAGMMFLALVCVAIPASFALGMRPEILPVLLLSLLIGIPVMTLIGGIMGAVTVSLRRHPAMLTLLLIPFYIPVLIFAVASCDAAALGASVVPHLLLLGAMLAVLLPIAPFIIAAALRNGQG